MYDEDEIIVNVVGSCVSGWGCQREHAAKSEF
jgi:hypothetical protein